MTLYYKDTFESSYSKIVSFSKTEFHFFLNQCHKSIKGRVQPVSCMNSVRAKINR